MGFDDFPSVACVFMKRASNREVIFLLVHVDDMIILSSSKLKFAIVVKKSRKTYEVRVHESVEWFLGVKIQWIADARTQ